MYTWLEHALCDNPIEKKKDTSIPDVFVNLFGKYGAKAGAVKAKELLRKITLI